MVKRKTIFAFVVMAAFAVAMIACACLLFCVRWMQPETQQKHLEWKGRCSVDVFGKYGYTVSDRMHVMPITEARRAELRSIYEHVAAAYSNCQECPLVLCIERMNPNGNLKPIEGNFDIISANQP